jgi:hypothetical protein
LFPPDAAAILSRANITKKQFARYTEALMLFMLRNFSGDFVISLQAAIRKGDKAAMTMFSQMMGLVKSDSPLVVNLNNSLSIGAPVSDRSFDSVVRNLDDRDRRALPGVIDVAPVN